MSIIIVLWFKYTPHNQYVNLDKSMDRKRLAESNGFHLLFRKR